MGKSFTKESLGVGIAGTGFIGPVHVEALRRNGVRVIGVAEVENEVARRKADELGIPRSYGSVDEMLADPEVHVVHLATPNYLHYPQAKAALMAGKHVVCEKPLAMNTSESGELVRLAAERCLVNVVNFNNRMYPLAQQARSMVQAGDIGDLLIVHGSYLQDWLLLPTDWNWRLAPEVGGNLRAVSDIGSHWLDLLTFISGRRVEELLADIKTFHPIRKRPAKSAETFAERTLAPEDYVDQPVSTEDYATILMHYEGGARGVLTVSQVSSGRKNRLLFEIDGSKSSLAWNSESPEELWYGHRTRNNETILKEAALLSPEARSVASYPAGHGEGFDDTFKQLYSKVYHYILAGDFTQTPDFPTFADGHYIMQLCAAVEQSARTNAWVKV